MGQLPLVWKNRFQTHIALPKYEEVVAIAETFTRIRYIEHSVESLIRTRYYSLPPKIYALPDGLFVPGLTEIAHIAKIAEGTDLPINLMSSSELPKMDELAKLNVRRLSGEISFLQPRKIVITKHRGRSFLLVFGVVDSLSGSYG